MTISRKTILIRFLATNKSIVVLTLISAFIGSLLSVLLPLSIGVYYELSFQDDSGKSQLLHDLGIHLPNLESYFIFFLCFVVLKAISSWAEAMGMRTIEERFAHRMRYLIFHAQINHHYTTFTRKSAGKYLLRYSSDMLALQYYLSKGIIKCIADILFLLLAFYILFRIDASLTGILLAIMAISALLMTALSRFQSSPNEARRDARSSLIGFIEQRLQAFTTIKAFNRAHPEEAKFTKRNDTLLKSAIRFHRINALNKSIPQIVVFIAVGTLLFCASPLFSDRPTAHGALLIFILMLLYMQSAFRRLLRVPSYLNAGATSFQSLTTLLNSPSEVMHTDQSPKDLANHLSIELQSVEFSYSDSKPLFNINHWQFPHPGIYRINGPSGSGKSTLLKLLLKLYSTTTGTIVIGGKDIREIGAHDLRKIMTIVGEDYPLVGKTIFEAISYSRKEKKKLEAAALLTTLGLTNESDASRYITATIKAQGSNLSSSERRMLNVARALLTGKPIILLDEPFLGLSSSMQAIIVRELMLRKESHLIILVSQEIPKELTIHHTFSL
jgi:ABC-type multidrug transport system fused ATPase/permease subunit